MNRAELIKAIAEEIAEEMLEHIEKLEPLTNGEVIQALFPNVGTNFSNVIDLNLWWNAKYKVESEGTE